MRAAMVIGCRVPSDLQERQLACGHATWPSLALRANFGAEPEVMLQQSLIAADGPSDHPLARTLGFDLALLEEREGLLVKFYLSSGVPTTLYAFVLIGLDLLHNYQTTHCASPVGYRSATPR
jgi:hypothetical protein